MLCADTCVMEHLIFLTSSAINYMSLEYIQNKIYTFKENV